MIIGAHSIIYSKNSDADRAFLRDVIGFPNVDVGGGWLIFGLPPGEIAIHPGEANDVHEFYLMCDDIEAFVADMEAHGVDYSPVSSQGWGMLTEVTMPGGGKLGVYQPRHARPEPMGVGGMAPRAAKKAAPAKKKAAPAKKKAAKQKPAAPAKKKAAPAKKPAAKQKPPKR